MITDFLYIWGMWILVALYFAYVFFIVISRTQITQKLIWYGIVGYVIASIGRITIGAFLTHHAWSISENLDKYYTLQYSNRIYELAGDLLIKLSISIGIGVIVLIIFSIIKKKWDSLLTQEEILLLSLGVGIVGWPNVFILVALIFILTVIRKLIYIALRKEKASDRIVILPAIPISIIITIFFGSQLAIWTGLHALR
ncbi:hypothetical protein ACFL0L_03295 [Patescibacteria group bacterium]